MKVYGTLLALLLIVAGAYSIGSPSTPDVNRGWNVAGFEWTSHNQVAGFEWNSHYQPVN